MSLLEQYDKFKKDNQYVVNWHRSLDKKELEIEKLRASNPTEYEKAKEDIARQRTDLALQLKRVKTFISIVEKAMISKVKQQYPNDSRLNGIDGRTGAKILRVNEKENRIVPVDEFMKYLNKNQPSNDKFMDSNVAFDGRISADDSFR